MKRTTSLILALAMLCTLFLSACGSGGNNSGDSGSSNTSTTTTPVDSSSFTASQADDTIIEHEQPIKVSVALSNSVSVFSPIMIVNPYNNIVGSGVYERLGERSQYMSTEFNGVMLKNWTVSDDGYKYTCEIYDYITDANGNKITSDDIEYSIKLQASEGKKGVASKMTDFEKIDDYNFIITVNENYEGFWIEFCEGQYMFSQKSYEESVANNTICAGTGPYVCTAFTSNVSARMEKRDDYWQTPELTTITSRANVDVIEYKIVSEVTQMGIQIATPSETQMAAFVTESLVNDAEADSAKTGVAVSKVPSAQTRLIVFNTANGPMADENLRKAICYCINNAALVQAALSGVGFEMPTMGCMNLMDYDKNWESADYYSYNDAKAREYFTAAGYNPDNVGLSLSFQGVQNAINQNIGAFLESQLSMYGITLTYELHEAVSNNNFKFDLDGSATGSHWDIYETGQTPSKLYNYLYFAEFGDPAYYGGHYAWGNTDAETDALVAKVKAGDEAAWEQYRNKIIDEALLYQYANGYFVITHVNEITNVVTDWRNSLCVGACTFSSDYNYLA